MSGPTVYLGTDVATGRPVTVSAGLFERHAWIQAMTGGQKTILACKVTEQLMGLDPSAAFVFCDLGGDQYAFNRLRALAAQNGKPFQFTSINQEDDFDTLDPMEAITPLTNIPLASSYLHGIFSGDHGEGYGTSYYGRVSYVSVQRVVNSCVSEGIHSPTMFDFVKRFSAVKGKLSEVSEVQLAAEILSTHEQIQPSEWGHKRIDVRKAMETGQVTYGFLPTLMQPGARMLATTLVFSFILEAMRRHYNGETSRPLYLVIDEFPSVAHGKQWADLIVLARKYNVRIIVVTQTSEQLKSRDRDLYPVLFDNTAVKLWLTPTSVDDVETLRSLSKDQLKQRGSTLGLRGGVSSVSMSEVFEPRLEANEIKDAAHAADQGFLITNAFKGHVDPIRFRFTHDVSYDEYLRLSRLPLPRREPSPPTSSNGRFDADYDVRQAAINALLAAKLRQLDWETEP